MKTFLSIVAIIVLSFTLIPAFASAQQVVQDQPKEVIKTSLPGAKPETQNVTGESMLADRLPSVVGADRKDYVRHFSLGAIPTEPKLTLEFSALQKGVCLITYKHTEMWLNNKLIERIDFRKMTIGVGQSLTIPIPRGTLKVGKNLLEISFGSCQYGIDVMRLDSLKLAEN